MRLPVIDIGLMNEHLATHEGLLGKLDVYLEATLDKFLMKLITVQREMLKVHIQVMLELLLPQKEEWVNLPNENLEEELDLSTATDSTGNELTKRISLELQATANSMARTNFNSALMMKNENVKQVHFEMAIQQATYLNYVNYFVEENEWSISVKGTEDQQNKIIEHFKHLV
ncbi:hypothetical protein CR203_08575 [Salipaludibacillus neizhouensis]|uniref:Spore coat protein n=1 Tax=Salipaludibacillus neizhouensis TaxID=885475 RepID=A0A3A9K7F1_9BACI|nr:hypothetical protein [Salipaludibacillus neizhouensis]RKL67408.1 hypothetical protein CR203_08575 [Salipaludibacillus neizhouensis]